MNGVIYTLKAEIYFDRPAFKNFILVGGIPYLHDRDQSISDVTELITLYSANRTKHTYINSLCVQNAEFMNAK
jgi:hypothetical protein